MAKSEVKAAGKAPARDLFTGALLFCATLIAYLPALNGGLVWDDAGHVTRPELQSLGGLWRIWFQVGSTQQYYPLLHSAFWLEHQLWGDAVLGYHLVNVALHATAACLAAAIMRRLALPGAWLAAFVFALHPVCVEAVAWISEQKSTLSAVFYLAAALAYLRFDDTRRRRTYFAASALFVFALLTKTVTATLPAALLVILWWGRGRIDWKRDVQPLLPWFALSLGAGLFTAQVERKLIGAEGADFALTLVQRLLLAGRAICFYFSKLIWPADLMFTYPRWSLAPDQLWQYSFPLAVIASAGCLAWMARKRRGPLASFLLFAGTLAPVLGFFNVYPFLYSYVADHFQYLASLGIIAAASAGVTLAAGRIPVRFRYTVLAVAVVVLGVATWRQSHIFSDAETLYRETLARNPGDWMGYNNLAMILAGRAEDLPEAVADFEAALRLKPDLPNTHYNLANALSQTPGRLQDAIPQYQAAIRLKPDFVEAHLSLAGALARIPGRLSESIPEYRAALRLQPENAEAHNNFGSALAELPGESARAMDEYRTALRINPDLAEAHYNLAVALARIPGRLQEAIGHLEAAERIRPDLETVRIALDRLRAVQR